MIDITQVWVWGSRTIFIGL